MHLYLNYVMHFTEYYLFMNYSFNLACPLLNNNNNKI